MPPSLLCDETYLRIPLVAIVVATRLAWWWKRISDIFACGSVDLRLRKGPIENEQLRKLKNGLGRHQVPKYIDYTYTQLETCGMVWSLFQGQSAHFMVNPIRCQEVPLSKEPPRVARRKIS